MQRKEEQTRRILNYYVRGRLEDDDERFDCLKLSGFLNVLLNCAVNAANFETFSNDIKRYAKEKIFRGNCFFHIFFTNFNDKWILH